jgi:hypothetical protein
MSTTRNEREKDQRDTKETQRESTNPLSTISTIVFQDICTIDDVNPEGKRYDKGMFVYIVVIFVSFIQ